MDDFSIKLGVQNIPVVHKSSDELDDIDNPDFKVVGRYRGDYPNPELHIWDELIGPRYNEIFTHELLEAINRQYDLELTHTQVGVLGAVVSQALMDNELGFLTKRED